MEDIIHQFLPGIENYIVTPLGDGLINKTYLVKSGASEEAFVLQRINNAVFKSPDIIEENIQKLSEFLNQKNNLYPFLSFLKTTSGRYFFKDDNEGYWRMYHYIKDFYSINTIHNANDAAVTAFEFGSFTMAFTGLDISSIRPSIPDFHNLSLRYEQFVESTLSASKDRLSNAAGELNYLLTRAFLVDKYVQIRDATNIPFRLIHADAKIGNILFNNSDNRPCCVIDYDTVMPGYFFSDLGDMVRTMCCTCDENETDLSKLSFRRDYYEALVTGYTKAVALTPGEKELIHFSGLFMTYMQALRFLTDYFNDDIYYAVSYKEHNLSRAKNQCRLLELMESELS